MNKTLKMNYSHSISSTKELEYKLLSKRTLFLSENGSLKRKRNLLVFSVIYGIVLGSLIFMFVNI